MPGSACETAMEAALQRLRAAMPPGSDGVSAIPFLLHCLMEAECGTAEHALAATAGGPHVGRTVAFDHGVEMQTVVMGSGSVVVHVLKPGHEMLHWVVSVADFAPAWDPSRDPADNLAAGAERLALEFAERIALPLAAVAQTAAVASAAASDAEVRRAREQPRRSPLEEPTFGGPGFQPPDRLRLPHAGRMPGAGLLGGGGVGAGGGMLIGPDHPGFFGGGVGGPGGRPRPGEANCNINANFCLCFLLKMQKERRIATGSDAFVLKNGRLF